MSEQRLSDLVFRNPPPPLLYLADLPALPDEGDPEGVSAAFRDEVAKRTRAYCDTMPDRDKDWWQSQSVTVVDAVPGTSRPRSVWHVSLRLGTVRGATIADLEEVVRQWESYTDMQFRIR